jgi:hypothetical protein
LNCVSDAFRRCRRNQWKVPLPRHRTRHSLTNAGDCYFAEPPSAICVYPKCVRAVCFGSCGGWPSRPERDSRPTPTPTLTPIPTPTTRCQRRAYPTAAAAAVTRDSRAKECYGKPFAKESTRHVSTKRWKSSPGFRRIGRVYTMLHTRLYFFDANAIRCDTLRYAAIRCRQTFTRSTMT